MAASPENPASSQGGPHFLGMAETSSGDLTDILGRGWRFGRGESEHPLGQPLAGRTVATLFFEASTRTRLSFELAARALGGQLLDFAAQGSSLAKGESLLDTGRTIDAMGGADYVVVRHGEPGAPHLLCRAMSGSIINAGDGAHAHPTQALLDALSIFVALDRPPAEGLEDFEIAIVGDIAHSRVARSNIIALKKLGAKIRLCGPPTMLPPQLANHGVEVTSDMQAAIDGVDAVMMLRIQKERMKEPLMGSESDYHRHYGLNEERLASLPDHAFVMHPGPMNRGVEIASTVADDPKSRILDQVKHGVWARAGVFDFLEEKRVG